MPQSVILVQFQEMKSSIHAEFRHVTLLMGGTLLVAQLVEALRYKSEGRGFDSRWCHWNFFFFLSFRPHCDPEVNSASN
jgi:hypothetical protein